MQILGTGVTRVCTAALESMGYIKDTLYSIGAFEGSHVAS